jgi:general secretion pathway protein G
MRQRGFTLVELMVTVAIIGILATVALPVAQLSLQRSKEQELRIALRQVRDAIDAHKQASDEGRIVRRAGQSGYPPSLQVLVDGVEDARSPKKARIYFLRRLPRDPFSADPAEAAALTWGKRSYASPPDDPREGDDVFDVYSLSQATGLNGVPYRNW